ncbi:MAG: hypothetical protein WA151_02450, partial [Desulfatirhabdiaceae bacterium]
MAEYHIEDNREADRILTVALDMFCSLVFLILLNRQGLGRAGMIHERYGENEKADFRTQDSKS